MGGPRNAGLFAVQVLATADPSLGERFAAFKASLVNAITDKDARLQQQIRSQK
jgi:5-(carboxyamino)imidazole ribonucleotide mutase